MREHRRTKIDSKIQPLAPALRLDDPHLFGNDAAEDEVPEILAGYFLEHAQLTTFFNREARLQVVRARKGMGKSAALAKLAYDIMNERTTEGSPDLVVRMTGVDLIGLGTFTGTDWSFLHNQWKLVILRAIASEYENKHIEPVLRSSVANKITVEHLSGFRNRRLADVLHERLSPGTSAQVGPSVNNIWIFIDDIDATFADTELFRARVSTFFSACRQLAREIDGLRIRASVRTDVWTALRKNEDLDKCEQYMSTLRWQKTELTRMLVMRIIAYISRNKSDEAVNIDHLSESEIIELGFKSRFRWGDNSVRPAQPLVILSAGRPRWLSQLCRLAGKEACRRSQARIGGGEVFTVMKEFGQLRLADLYKEHSHQFADLQRATDAFSRAGRRYTYSSLERQLVDKYVFPRGAGNIPDIDGQPYRHPKQLIRFFYKINFLMARNDADGDGSNPSFIDYDGMPDFLSEDEVQVPPYSLEVHPSYRVALGIK